MLPIFPPPMKRKRREIGRRLITSGEPNERAISGEVEGGVTKVVEEGSDSDIEDVREHEVHGILGEDGAKLANVEGLLN